MTRLDSSGCRELTDSWSHRGPPIFAVVSFRVATFNIHHGEGLDGAIDLERTAAVIRRTEAELVALQEVDRGLRRSGNVDQPAVLSELTGLHVHYRPTIRRGDGDYGMALAADEPLEVDFDSLPAHPGREPRGVLSCRWRGLSVLATHLSPRPILRRAQTDALAELAARMEPPTVLLGDLNQRPRRLAPLTEAGFRTSPSPRATMARLWRRGQIDHVLFGPGLRLVRAAVVGGGASDHRAFVVELERAENYR